MLIPRSVMTRRGSAAPQDAILQLFHMPGDHAWSPGRLVIFFFIYAFYTCWTYGASVPSGLFIPSLLSGSAFGRIVGDMLNHAFPGRFVDPGTYSLIGAAAFLGGMARMTISLAVILLESTGDYQFGLPLMVTLLAARWTGNVFNEGLYDIHIELRHWPLLEQDPLSVVHKLSVQDVMSPDPVVVDMVRCHRGCVAVCCSELRASLTPWGFAVQRSSPRLRTCCPCCCAQSTMGSQCCTPQR